MPEIDYESVAPSDLELVRQPRQSKFTVLHKPTGTVGEKPVSPTSHKEVRFRRPSILPKENRTPDMEGYVEVTEAGDQGFWPIVGGDNPYNDYLKELCTDPVALALTFGDEATAETPAAPPEEVPSAPPEPELTPLPESEVQLNGDSVSEPVESPSSEETVSNDDLKDLDDLLAGLEDSPSTR